MRIKISKGKVRGEVKWILSVTHNDSRKRKYFNTAIEASRFNALAWMNESLLEKPCGIDTTIEFAITDYIADYERRHPRANTKQLKQRLGHLRAFKRVRDIEPKKLSALIESKVCEWGKNKGKLWSKSSRQTAKTVWQIFLSWCSHKEYAPERDWTIKILNVDTPSKKIGILTPAQAHGLLKEINPAHQPAMALMLFTGIRPEGEMSRLRYENIKWGNHIKIPGEIAKWDSRQIYDLPKVVWDYIPKKREGQIMSTYSALNQSRRRACKRLGFAYPADGARHSFATYGYWVKGMEWTMHTMGHADYNTFQRFYRNKEVTPQLAKEYFRQKRRGE